MERLTKKDDFFDYVLPEQNIFGDNQAFEISLGKTEYTCKLHITGEAIKRFGELEDVLEKYNIENLDDFIKEYSSRNIKLANDNYALEQELTESESKRKSLEEKLDEAQNPKEIRFNGFVVDCNYDEARKVLQEDILKMWEENKKLKESEELSNYAKCILKNKKLEEDLELSEQEIQELKQQLEEKEQESERLKEEICKYEITLMDKNSQLKNQLHGLPKKIVGEIKTEVEKEKSDNDLAWLGFKKLNRILDTILKKYGGEDE